MTGARVELEHPVVVGGETISTLAMRRPKVRDERDARRMAGEDDGDREIVLLANLCEVAPQMLHELDLADYRRLQEAYLGFFPPASREETPSDAPPRG